MREGRDIPALDPWGELDLVWRKMSSNHIELHHELKQRTEFVRLAVTLAGFAVASVPEEIPRCLLRK